MVHMYVLVLIKHASLFLVSSQDEWSQKDVFKILSHGA